MRSGPTTADRPGSFLPAGNGNQVEDARLPPATTFPELVYGELGTAIPELAEGYDLLLVGHRGHSGNAERVLGSVARAPVERSPVPVTVMR